MSERVLQVGMSINLVEAAATFFYVGKIRKAPGTWGTMAAVPFALLFAWWGAPIYVAATILVALLAIFASHYYEMRTGNHDSSEIVIDEVAGFFVAMALIPPTLGYVVLAFVLFRLFDIFKPFPIGYVDKNVNGGLGVVLDDLLAGLVVNVILQVMYRHFEILL